MNWFHSSTLTHIDLILVVSAGVLLANLVMIVVSQTLVRFRRR